MCSSIGIIALHLNYWVSNGLFFVFYESSGWWSSHGVHLEPPCIHTFLFVELLLLERMGPIEFCPMWRSQPYVSPCVEHEWKGGYFQLWGIDHTRHFLYHPSLSPAAIVWKVVGQHLLLNIILTNFMAGTRWKDWCDRGHKWWRGGVSHPPLPTRVILRCSSSDLNFIS